MNNVEKGIIRNGGWSIHVPCDVSYQDKKFVTDVTDLFRTVFHNDRFSAIARVRKACFEAVKIWTL